MTTIWLLKTTTVLNSTFTLCFKNICSFNFELVISPIKNAIWINLELIQKLYWTLNFKLDYLSKSKNFFKRDSCNKCNLGISEDATQFLLTQRFYFNLRTKYLSRCAGNKNDIIKIINILNIQNIDHLNYVYFYIINVVQLIRQKYLSK